MILILISCNKREHLVNLDLTDIEKKESLSTQIEDVFIDKKENEISFEKNEEKIEEPQKWVYTFPEEYIQESTTDKYFSRQDWYEHLDYGISNLLYVERPEEIRNLKIFMSEKGEPFYYDQEYDYNNGLQVMWKNRRRDTMDDGYVIYNEFNYLLSS